MLYGLRVPHGCVADEPTADESCMGWWVDAQKTAQNLPLADPRLQTYVDDVANRLARAAGDSRTYHVRIWDRGDIAGESNVGPQLYVTRGALVRLRDEAELAALLGHEIGHVVSAHMFEPVAEMSNGMREQSRTLVDQRDDEIQADELAVLYMHRLGYEVTAAERMLRALQAGQPDIGDGNHPRIEERVTRLRAYAWRFPGGVTNAEAYRARITGMVVGEDPRIDAIVDNVMVFAPFDVAIPLPTDFQIAMASAVDIDVSLTEDDTSIQVSNVVARAVPDLVKQTAYYAITRGDRALLIRVVGPRKDQVLAALRSSIREIRPNERVRLVPTIVNLASRAMWPESPKDDFTLTFATSVVPKG